MKTLKELKARQAEAKAEGRALLAAAERAGRELNAAEELAFQALETELEGLATAIAAKEREADRRRAMEGTASPSMSSHIEVGADRSTLDPKLGFRSLADFAGSVHRANPQNPNAILDQRLANMYQAAPSGTMREGGSSDGYMVPPEFRDRIWELVFAGDNLMSEIDSEPTNSNQVNDLSDDWTPWGGTGVQAKWRSEASQMTATADKSPVPRSVILHELYAFVIASDELLQDAPRLNSRLENKAAAAINWKLDDSIQFGNGVGKPLGFMNSPALISVAKDASQAAATLSVGNIVNMFARMLGDSVGRAYWRMNSDVLPSLITMTHGGQPIWTPPSTGIVGAPGGTLLGRPIRFSEHCKTLGTKGDVMLVDPKGYYGLRKEGGIQFASSIHLYFDYGLQAFRWTVRFGGQPHLKAPMSPANGTNTKSHFVTLDTRA